jgi:hypothetical protein
MRIHINRNLRDAKPHDVRSNVDLPTFVSRSAADLTDVAAERTPDDWRDDPDAPDEDEAPETPLDEPPPIPFQDPPPDAMPDPPMTVRGTA